MRTLIVLKGLVKQHKLEWVSREGLNNYLIDINLFRRMYSSPDLLTPNHPVLGKAFGDLVYSRFMDVVCTRMSKGCLLVVDSEDEGTNTLDTLALIFGYTVFYVVFGIPQDYIGDNKKYAIPYYAPRRKTDLEKDVDIFLGANLEGRRMIRRFQDVIDYWAKISRAENTRSIYKEDRILHISDLHSNVSLYKKLPDTNSTDLTIYYGDYIDGPEAGGSKYLLDAALDDTRRNVVYLEGNHEMRLRKYLGWIILKSSGKKDIADILYRSLPDDFLSGTALEFDMDNLAAREYLEKMNKTLKMFFILNLGGQQYICTHAGILYKEQLDPRYIGNVIYGNREMNRFDRSFSGIGKKINLWSVHAHCKYPDSWEVLRYDRVVNLDPPSEEEIVYGIQTNGDWEICLLEK